MRQGGPDSRLRATGFFMTGVWYPRETMHLDKVSSFARRGGIHGLASLDANVGEEEPADTISLQPVPAQRLPVCSLSASASGRRRIAPCKCTRRGDIEGQQLRHDQSADNGESQRTARLGACAQPQGNRHGTRERRERGHHDGPEAHQTGFGDRLFRRGFARARAASAKSIIMMAFFSRCRQAG